MQFVQSPVTGADGVLGATYSQYRLFLGLRGDRSGARLAAILNGTRLGLSHARGHHERGSRARARHQQRARALHHVFSGAGLASLAGALITPLSSVDPNMGVPWLVNAFMLVMVSGVSLASLAVACLVLGGAQVLVSTYGNPVLGGLTIVVLAALLLRLRPQGFARE